jgi:hypothetical protein
MKEQWRGIDVGDNELTFVHLCRIKLHFAEGPMYIEQQGHRQENPRILNWYLTEIV